VPECRGLLCLRFRSWSRLSTVSGHDCGSCVAVGCVCPGLILEPLDQMLKILESSSCSRGDFSDKSVRCSMKCL
jgi:hypothetical protein